MQVEVGKLAQSRLALGAMMTRSLGADIGGKVMTFLCHPPGLSLDFLEYFWRVKDALAARDLLFGKIKRRPQCLNAIPLV